jgi:arginyl-tRNA synthetase
MLLSLLTKHVAAAFEARGYDPALGAVTVSDRWDLCQFQCNGAFAAAKLYKKAPMAIAGEVAENLAGRANHTAPFPVFAKAEAVPPGFINITLCDTTLVSLADALAADPHTGVPQAETPMAILLDYGGANVAKALHIGHMRPANIGEAVKRLAKASGHTVTGDVHLGDWGLQMGQVIAELIERGIEDEPMSVELFNEVYPASSNKCKTNPEFKRKAGDITAALQKGDPVYTKIWREMVRVSVEDAKRLYTRLNADFELWLGESDAQPYADRLVDVLQASGHLYRSEGALVVDIATPDDKAPMPPVLVQKTDGSAGYPATDLATILMRAEKQNPDAIWYVTDGRQQLHFEQVFRCARKTGLCGPDVRLEHLWHGAINGPDGKPFKTRDGGVMSLEGLLDMVVEGAKAKLSDENAGQAGPIAMAAIKFGDLINHRTRDYIFDMDKFLAAEGKTGVYLLYTVTRIASILRKTAGPPDPGRPPDEAITLHGVYTNSERELLLRLLLSSEAFAAAMKERAPSFVAESAYQIAAAFSTFYHENHIASQPAPEIRETWLSLCRLARRSLLKHLDVLAIDAVEVM